MTWKPAATALAAETPEALDDRVELTGGSARAARVGSRGERSAVAATG